MRLRQSISVAARDALLLASGQSPAVFNPHRFLYSRAAPNSPFMEVFCESDVVIEGYTGGEGERQRDAQMYIYIYIYIFIDL